MSLSTYLSCFRALEGISTERLDIVFLDQEQCILAHAHFTENLSDRVGLSYRELIGRGIEMGAVAMIVAHNHPGGKTSPSPSDYRFTRKLSQLGKALDIPLIDHLIIGSNSHYSFRAEGLL